jgi:hypothetical protein
MASIFSFCSEEKQFPFAPYEHIKTSFLPDNVNFGANNTISQKTF